MTRSDCANVKCLKITQRIQEELVFYATWYGLKQVAHHRELCGIISGPSGKISWSVIQALL